MAKSKLSPIEVNNWRRSMKLSIEQFAAFAGTASGRTVRRWEDGTRDIPEYLDILYDLSKAPAIRDWMVKRADDTWNKRLDDEQDAEEQRAAASELESADKSVER